MTTGKVYADFDALIRKAENWLQTQEIHVAYCDPAHVRKRIVQRIIQLTNDSFSIQALLNNDTGIRRFDKLELHGISIETVSGRIRVSGKLLFFQLTAFLVSWLKIFYRLFVSLFVPSGMHRSVTVLSEAGGDYLANDAKLVEFCRKGPVTALHEKLLIIGSKAVPAVRNDKDIIYTPEPYIEAAIRTSGFAGRLQMIARHLLLPLQLVAAILNNRLSVVLGNDMAYLAMMAWLNGNDKLPGIVITTSGFLSQPLWMKGLTDQRSKLHMIWYSQNFIPKAYRGETVRPDLPAARHMRVDVHWVWTEGFRQYLTELGQLSEIHVVGPLLWYLDTALPRVETDTTYFRVAVFDINPAKDHATPFGAVKNYYNASLMKRFVTDILSLRMDIEAATGKKARFLLKHKRAQAGTHDPAYFSFIEALLQQRPELELVDHSKDVFDLIRNTDISVSIPYTSTCYVSAYLKKHACYYDPFAEVVPFYEPDPFVHFASGPQELAELVPTLAAGKSRQVHT